MELRALVKKHLKNFTVIATVYEILDAQIRSLENAQPFSGLSAQQVANGFNERAKTAGKLWFFPSYLQRHAKSGDFFVEKDGKYLFRSELTRGLTRDSLITLRESILTYWAEQEGAREALIAEFSACAARALAEIDVRRETIEKHLACRDSQVFEVLSFSVLFIYFRALGFSLRRFSTTFANDGGMDFVSGDGIYQVTCSPTKTKIQRDLAKLPGTKRVLVAPKFGQSIWMEAQTHESVLGLIEGADLRHHFLHWLYQADLKRGAARNLQNVLEVTMTELARD